MEPDLIAEIDDDGRVLWVWIKEPDAPCARPVRDVAADRELLLHATCQGASCAAVRRWFDDHSAAKTRPHSA